MEAVIQFFVEHAVTLLSIVIFLLGLALTFLRAKLKAVGNDVVIGLKILQEALDEQSPGGKELTDKEVRLLVAQGKRVLEEGVRQFGPGWLKTLLGVKEPEEQEIYY